MGRPAFSRLTGYAPASRRRWATTSRNSWTRSGSNAACSPATTGAGEPRASSPRSGRSAYSAWSPPTATTSRTLPPRPNRHRPSRSIAFGINTTFTPSAAARDLRPTGASFVDSSGNYGRRIGDSMTRPMTAPPRRLTAKPRISVPTIVLHGDGSGLSPSESSLKHAAFFTGPYQRRVIPSVGHNLPQEAPDAFADAVLELVRATK